ncbi:MULTISPECIES: GyrI-like domain-containing protein [unclassified Streptomyces]|uniref:GyrI-like domain-containing protein n=1 Tax=unclassified Streptomyces TaxID=2593676 RepID=UPI002E13FEBD|nr:GyrI-like domain-containing protein [Streptomyces sp. NBC_01197]WSS51018.1 GyrI-like domain-containing protein [Streptomyces sp. NBC_01180]
MQNPPVAVERAAQPYAAIRETVTMDTFPVIADRLVEVFGRLADRGIEPAGAPFFRYDVIDVERGMEVEAGVPVAQPLEAAGWDVNEADADAGEVFTGTLPAGRYLTVTHIGHPDELLGVTAGLLEYAAARGMEWDMAKTDVVEEWGCRLEIYKTDPREEPDMSKWETELAFRLADPGSQR